MKGGSAPAGHVRENFPVLEPHNSDYSGVCPDFGRMAPPKEGGAIRSLESGTSRSTVRGRCQSRSQEVGGCLPPLSHITESLSPLSLPRLLYPAQASDSLAGPETPQGGSPGKPEVKLLHSPRLMLYGEVCSTQERWPQSDSAQGVLVVVPSALSPEPQIPVSPSTLVCSALPPSERKASGCKRLCALAV